jgi:ABC-type nitrate/sulfonate/bicarbonate transport system permease component
MKFGVKLLWFMGSLFVGFAFVLLWQKIADARVISPTFLPGPDRAWVALVEGLQNGDLVGKSQATVLRMLYGWLLASFAGLALGATIGVSPTIRAYLEPSLEALRPLPASALFPVAIVLFGLSNQMVLSVIAFGALWPIMLATVHGFASVEPSHYELSRALGMSRFDTICKIALPSAMPDILAASRLGLTVSLILAVVGEMLTGSEGLGYHVLNSARTFRSADLYAGVIILGAIGVVSAMLLSALERWLLRWQMPN